jgi:hypothetical protein
MIYIDEPSEFYSRPNWCHMATDGDIEELHTFAKQIGMRRSWFQGHHLVPHYDLSPNKQRHALDMGAVKVTRKELLQKCRKE